MNATAVVDGKKIGFSDNVNVRTFNRNNRTVKGNSKTPLPSLNKNTRSTKTRRTIRTVPHNKMANYLPYRNSLREAAKNQRGIQKNFYKYGIINASTYKKRSKEINVNLNYYLNKYAESLGPVGGAGERR
jgi:hypothetical protein